MPRRLGKQLVMPEPDAPAEQLRSRAGERRVPEQIVEPRFDPPMPQRMEQHRPRGSRLVRMELVKQTVTRMRRVEQPGEFFPQNLDLLVGQNPDAGEVPVLLKEGDLFVSQPLSVPGSQCSEWFVYF